jgi:Uma2 family endonuclease
MVADLKVPRPYYSMDEYFALEHAGDARYEYWDGDIVCMSGGSQAHLQISNNIFFRLRLQLRDGPCRAYTSDLPVLTPTLPPFRYPDVTVGCGELKYQHIRGVDALTNPVLLVEVLYPTTEVRDREQKFAAYQTIPTFVEYLLVFQDEPHVIHYSRQIGGAWLRQDVQGLHASLALHTINSTLLLSDVYEEVKFTNAS